MSVFTFDATFRTKYQDEFKMDFERSQAKLKMAVRSDGVVRGDQVKWDVVDPGDIANVRGRNGNIPISQIGFSQVTGTLLEHFKKYRIDSFDEFRGNPNVRTAMNNRGSGAINRAIDQTIIDAMDASSTPITASTDGASNQAAALSTLARVDNWLSYLLEADVPADDGEIWAVVSVKAWLQMQRIAEFKSSDYIDYKPMPDMPTSRVLRWQGVNWLSHNGLTGKGTAACKMYMFHKSAIGHQVDGDPAAHPFTEEDEDRYGVWFRTWHLAKTCLPRGIVQFYHDDTALLA
jgi:Phage capsid protein